MLGKLISDLVSRVSSRPAPSQNPGAPDVDRIRAALLLEKAGQIAQAERIYRELLAHAPDNPDLLHLLGNALRFRGELDEAIERLQRAVLFAPSNAVLL